MAQKEIWFTCPTCARPIRVSGKFIGAEFVHPACGATVRAPDPSKGRDEVELVAPPPEPAEEGLEKAKIEGFESSGLFVPRRLREGGSEVDTSSGESSGGDEDVHELAEKIARALLKSKAVEVESEGDDEIDVIEDAVAEVTEPEDAAGEGEKPPLSQKISHLASGKAPVDPEQLKQQFNKSLDILKGDAPPEVDEDILAAHKRMSTAREEYVVKSMTPWEAADDEDSASCGGPGMSTRGRWVFGLIAVVVIVLCVLVITKAFRGDKNKENPTDKPLRGRVVD